ncbi:MAG TPA: DUF6268 family outer membrane beta-barrel protein [Thermoguttaceae bacterium]|nr:DUF6268 family outer membrane beta-barrel protein [Thermoguttaceae bacterium]
MLAKRPRVLVIAAALCIVCSGTLPSRAQVVRLPPVDAAEPYPYPGRLVSYPDSTAEVLQAPGELSLPKEPERPPDAREGMFQKLIFTGEWLPGGGSDRFGVGSVELKSVLALPIPSREYPLIVTPGFAVHYLDGPISRDLPPRLYDAYAQFRWMRRLSPRLGIDLAITPGVFSDFEQGDADAFRITGHGAAMWTAGPDFKIVLGAAYIDRFSTDVLPIAGFIWTPHEDVEFELVFPNPRIARRIDSAGACTDDVQDWLYVAGEFGGGIWSVQRASGAADVVDYTDWRIFLGLQRKAIGRLDRHVEIGYVFAREIRYAGATPDLEPNDTVMLRGGVTY